MEKWQRDFEFLQRIIREFFREKQIIKRLNQFDEEGIYGWEIWLQVELYLFLKLKKCDEVSEVYREEPCLIDKRKNKGKTKCAIDFIIRKKYNHSFIPLEIKQSSYAPRCINQMIRDVEKYNAIKIRSLPTDRPLWCLGVHKEPIKINYIENLLEDFEPKILCEKIKGTNFFFTLF